MKKLYTIFAAAALAMLPVCFTGCTDEPLDTNQYSAKAVKLVSFGPNPVMRGGAVTFIGSNLDKIVEVQVPGVDPVTDIEVVSSGERSEIRVIIPAEGPEVGKLVLVASDGTTLSTSVDLEYSEPIVFEKFEVNTPAYPGDVVKLKGDYMNLVKSVEFSGGEKSPVTVIDRHNATTVVPATAVTGKIILSDEGEIANLIYSETDLQIGDPTVSSVKAASWKPGQNATISGKYLNMIKELHLEGDVTIAVEEFVLAEDSQSIVFVIPALAKSGSVTAVSYAGKEFEAGKAEMVVPTELAVNPVSVKHNETIEISGKDLDVVTSVEFPNAAAITEFTVEGGKISVAVPVEAKAGDITLRMSNDEVVTVAYTLVLPTVTGVAPVALKAGETITVTGTGLNLVKSATLGGKEEAIEANEDGTELVITTTNTSVSGKIVLTLFNGETLEPTEQITLSYDSFIVVNSMPSEAHIGALVTLKGSNFLMIENIYVGEAKVTSYGSRSDSELSFVMPYNKIGTYSITFNLLSGESEVCPTTIDVLLELKTKEIWSGSTHIAWSGMSDLSWGGYDWSTVKAGTIMTVFYTLDADQTYWQLRFGNGSWSSLPSGKAVAGADGDGNISLVEGSTSLAIRLTQEDIDMLVSAGGLVMTGTNYTLTGITLSEEISQEVTIWTGSFDAAGWSGNQDLAWGGYDWSTVKAGQSLVFYLTTDPSSTYWQLSLRHGQNWGELPEQVFIELTADQTRVEVPLTQTNIDDLVANGGLVMTGCYYVLTEVAIL